jgi:hypothetical protein
VNGERGSFNTYLNVLWAHCGYLINKEGSQKGAFDSIIRT